jgi:ABC-type antimicrobial peptide transport system permease subunit
MKIFFHEKIALKNGTRGIVFVALCAAGIGGTFGLFAGVFAAAILAELLKLPRDSESLLRGGMLFGTALGALLLGWLCAKRLRTLQKKLSDQLHR